MSRLRSWYTRASGDVRCALRDAALVAVATEAAWSAAGPVLPALHLPAADVAAVSGVITALTGFVSWAVRKHLITADKTSTAGTPR